MVIAIYSPDVTFAEVLLDTSILPETFFRFWRKGDSLERMA